jgi:hypothetical protein
MTIFKFSLSLSERVFNSYWRKTIMPLKLGDTGAHYKHSLGAWWNRLSRSSLIWLCHVERCSFLYLAILLYSYIAQLKARALLANEIWFQRWVINLLHDFRKITSLYMKVKYEMRITFVKYTSWDFDEEWMM